MKQSLSPLHENGNTKPLNVGHNAMSAQTQLDTTDSSVPRKPWISRSAPNYGLVYHNYANRPTIHWREDVPESSESSSSETHRHYEEERAGERACGHWFEYALVVALAALLLLAALVLALFWALYYRQGFAWSDDPERQFNLHPVLMVAGFVTFSGFSVLLYRVCRCCRRLHVKLFHTIFHALAIPCVVVGFWAAFDWHNLKQNPLPNFHSLHSWMGLVTMGLFALQFVVGFFSFLILLCCEGATAAFRASLVPIHASFGITTFMLAIATCLTGLTQKAYELYGAFYPTSWSEEGIIINALAMVLVALGILVSYTVRREGSRGEAKTFLSERL